jgi:hypothetical protein
VKCDKIIYYEDEINDVIAKISKFYINNGTKNYTKFNISGCDNFCICADKHANTQTDPSQITCTSKNTTNVKRKRTKRRDNFKNACKYKTML